MSEGATAMLELAAFITGLFVVCVAPALVVWLCRGRPRAVRGERWPW